MSTTGKHWATAATEQRRIAVLLFVAGFRERHPYGPTRREIAAHMGGSLSATQQYQVVALKAAGLLEDEPMVARSLRVTPAGYNFLSERGYVFDTSHQGLLTNP